MGNLAVTTIVSFAILSGAGFCTAQAAVRLHSPFKCATLGLELTEAEWAMRNAEQANGKSQYWSALKRLTSQGV